MCMVQATIVARSYVCLYVSVCVYVCIYLYVTCVRARVWRLGTRKNPFVIGAIENCKCILFLTWCFSFNPFLISIDFSSESVVRSCFEIDQLFLCVWKRQKKYELILFLVGIVLFFFKFIFLVFFLLANELKKTKRRRKKCFFITIKIVLCVRLILNVRVEQSVNSVKRLTFTRRYSFFSHFEQLKPADSDKKNRQFFRPGQLIRKKEFSLSVWKRKKTNRNKKNNFAYRFNNVFCYYGLNFH